MRGLFSLARRDLKGPPLFHIRLEQIQTIAQPIPTQTHAFARVTIPIRHDQGHGLAPSILRPWRRGLRPLPPLHRRRRLLYQHSHGPSCKSCCAVLSLVDYTLTAEADRVHLAHSGNNSKEDGRARRHPQVRPDPRRYPPHRRRIRHTQIQTCRQGTPRYQGHGRGLGRCRAEPLGQGRADRLPNLGEGVDFKSIRDWRRCNRRESGGWPQDYAELLLDGFRRAYVAPPAGMVPLAGKSNANSCPQHTCARK